MKPTHPERSIEILEDRIAPAGLVTVAYSATTGELTLTGDLAANIVSVFQVGPNQYRIEGAATTLNPGGVTFMDIGKLTKVTILGGVGNDEFSLFNLRTLTSLTLDGGGGADEFTVDNLSVKGVATFNGGDGNDLAIFRGVSTVVSGNFVVNDTTGDIQVNFDAARTQIGGSLLVNGGTGDDTVTTGGQSIVSIAKGVKLDVGAGGSLLRFESLGLVKIGKLPTGESILYTAGDGNDDLEFAGSATLAGGIRMTTGGDVDEFRFTGEAAIVKMGKTPSGHSIFFDGGANETNLEIETASIIAAGGFEFITGDATNAFDFDGRNGRITVGKLPTGQSIKYVGGASSDDFTISTSTLVLAGSLDLAMGGLSGTFTLENGSGVTKIGKGPDGVSVRCVGSRITFTAESSNLSLAGGMEVTSTADQVDLLLNGENGRMLIGKMTSGHSIKLTGGGVTQFSSEVASFTALGGIECVGGTASTNTFSMFGQNAAVNIGKLSSGASLRFQGGSLNDVLSLTVSNVNLAGGVDFNGGGGFNTLRFDNQGVTRVGALSTGESFKYVGGDSADTLDLGSGVLALKGSVVMTGGNGDNDVSLGGVAVTVGKSPAGVSVAMTGGTGPDIVALHETVTLAGSLTLDGGSGADQLALSGMASVKIGGDVTFNGGPGSNEFHLEADTITLAKSLTVTNGDGGSEVTIFGAGSIGGDVSLNLGASIANPQMAAIRSLNGLPSGLLLKGGLTVVSTATAAEDSFELANVAVTRAVSVTMGAGVSTVIIDNLVARDTLTIATGEGGDSISIERNNLFGNSVIAKLATIQAGGGTDSVLIGSLTPAPNGGVADSTRVRFLGGLTVDGGPGSDTRSLLDPENDFPLTPPAITSFEATTL
jgi:hypothetical protein